MRRQKALSCDLFPFYSSIIIVRQFIIVTADLCKYKYYIKLNATENSYTQIYLLLLLIINQIFSVNDFQ